MNQDHRENLSAAIDGELSKEELRFLLRRIDHDQPLRDAWARYHVVGDSMRKQLPPLAGGEFSARVMRAVEKEPARRSGKSHTWLRWSAGGAIAASVTVAALMISQPVGDVGSASNGVTTSAVARNAAPRSTVAVASVPRQAVQSFSSSKPAIVPPWFGGNAAGPLSQQASATFGAPFDPARSNYARGLSTYPSAHHRYRKLDNNDGSYLLLLDPQQSGTTPLSAQAGASAQ